MKLTYHCHCQCCTWQRNNWYVAYLHIIPYLKVKHTLVLCIRCIRALSTLGFVPVPAYLSLRFVFLQGIMTNYEVTLNTKPFRRLTFVYLLSMYMICICNYFYNGRKLERSHQRIWTQALSSENQFSKKWVLRSEIFKLHCICQHGKLFVTYESKVSGIH